MAAHQHTKDCKDCGARLPLSAFALHYGTKRPGPRCKPCDRAKQRRYRIKARQTVVPATKGIRICSRCGLIRDMTEFPIQYSATDGRMASCKFCENKRQRIWRSKAVASRPDFVAARQLSQDKNKAKRYGLTLEEYRELEKRVTGKCEICLKPPRCRKAWRADSRLHIDHDHETGKVRGLLCTDCNRAIGLLGDDADTLLRAADYLCRHT